MLVCGEGGNCLPVQKKGDITGHHTDTFPTDSLSSSWLSLILSFLPMLDYVDSGTMVYKSHFIQRILPTGKVVMVM